MSKRSFLLVIVCFFLKQSVWAVENAVSQTYQERLEKYTIASHELLSLSDESLLALLKKEATRLSIAEEENISISVAGVPVFVKKVPLTSLEQQRVNVESTVNIFNLPVYYQYCIGSEGFGVWRELAINKACTEHVLTNRCTQFPLMYHYRVLPGKNSLLTLLSKQKFYWGNLPEITARLQAIGDADAFVVFFFEQIPQTLNDYLDMVFTQGPQVIDNAIIMIENNVSQLTKFLKIQNIQHGDAHFDNILTDGNQLFLADMGLSISLAFDLSAEEIAFFREREFYDIFFIRALIAYGLAFRIVGGDDQKAQLLLSEYSNGKTDMLISPIVTSLLKRYALYWGVLDFFMTALEQSSCKATIIYPKDAIAALCRGTC